MVFIYCVECGLTKSACEKSPLKGAPSYDVIAREKPKCRPSRPIPPSALSVQVPLQNLGNHTVDRILLDSSIQEHVKQLKEKYGTGEISFIFKMGLDGSKGHPVFNQVIPETRVQRSVLFSQMVPLQLVAKVPDKGIPFVLWDNKVFTTCLENQ